MVVDPNDTHNSRLLDYSRLDRDDEIVRSIIFSPEERFKLRKGSSQTERNFPDAVATRPEVLALKNFWLPIDFETWIEAMETLCIEIPDLKRPEYAMMHINRKFRSVFEAALNSVRRRRTRPMSWAEFKDLAFSFDCE